MLSVLSEELSDSSKLHSPVSESTAFSQHAAFPFLSVYPLFLPQHFCVPLSAVYTSEPFFVSQHFWSSPEPYTVPMQHNSYD